MAHRLRRPALARNSPHLRAVESDATRPGHPRLAPQSKHLDKGGLEGFNVKATESGRPPEVRRFDAKRHIVRAALLDAT